MYEEECDLRFRPSAESVWSQFAPRVLEVRWFDFEIDNIIRERDAISLRIYERCKSSL